MTYDVTVTNKMAPKVSGRVVKRIRKKGKNARLRDFMCPICLSLLIEPVTLPCKHEFCKVCFKESVEKATLCCPLCRLRVSSWSRKATNEGTLVNNDRWKLIQRLFPEQVHNTFNDLSNDVFDEDGMYIYDAMKFKLYSLLLFLFMIFYRLADIDFTIYIL